MVTLYALVAAFGVAQVFPQHGGLIFLHSFLINSAATTWAAADSRKRGHPMQHGVQLIVFFTWPVALPIYLIRSQGFRGIGWVLVHTIGLAASYVFFFTTASYLS